LQVGLPDALEALARKSPMTWGSASKICGAGVTHSHPDHHGLAERLVKLASCGL
jgi:glyoxylase-like metal-dependent hydrolase (beta-lactamase superfamily II)